MLVGGAPGPSGPPRGFLEDWPEGMDPATCRACHAAVVADWEADFHSKARTDPEMDNMVLNKGFVQTDCNSCHAPRPVFERGLAVTPARRELHPERGVDCVSCHATAEGMASAKPGADRMTLPNGSRPPCRPVYRPGLGIPEHCGSCHNQHGTVDQWRQTSYAEPGEAYRTCQACHMPARSHRMVGAHDLPLLRSGAKLSLAAAGAEAVVSVDTRATAHNFPTDYRTRFGLLRVEALGGDGVATGLLLERKFRQPFRHEPGGSDASGNTQVKGDTVHEWRVPLPADGGKLRARLFYSLRPYNDAPPGEFTTDELDPTKMLLLHEATGP
ncbi:MAG: cytochrome c family protein [Planctomycetales bacterium]|nr:cytochrome c family protein [Planctomycetales bacterium]